jgi:hypothetical protein
MLEKTDAVSDFMNVGGEFKRFNGNGVGARQP